MKATVTTTEEAVREIERLARSLAMRNGMVSGYLTVNVGAGSPDYFYEIIYQHDGYDAGGWAKQGGSVSAHGPTLVDAVNRLLAALALPA